MYPIVWCHTEYSKCIVQMDFQISPFVELFENLGVRIPFAEVLKLFAGLPFNRNDFPVKYIFLTKLVYQIGVTGTDVSK